MQPSTNFPLTKSKLLSSLTFRVQAIFNYSYKRHNLSGFKILNFPFFFIISTQTTYFNKKLRTLSIHFL